MSVYEEKFFCKYCKNQLKIPGEIVLGSHLFCYDAVDKYKPNFVGLFGRYHGFKLPQIQINFLTDLEDMVKAVDQNLFDETISRTGIPLYDLNNFDEKYDNDEQYQVACGINTFKNNIEVLIVNNLPILFLPNSCRNLKVH